MSSGQTLLDGSFREVFAGPPGGPGGPFRPRTTQSPEPMTTFPQSGARILLVLATLTTTAYFVADGATGLVGASVLGVDDPEVSSEAGPVAVAAREDKSPSRILERNIFDHEAGSILNPPVAEAEPCEGDDCPSETACPEGPEGAECRGEVIPAGGVPTCDGSLRLVASIYRPGNEEWSFASIIGAAGDSRTYRVGETIDGRVVLGVYPEQVHLQPEGGGRCRLALFDDGEAPAARPTPMAAAPMVSMATEAQANAAAARERSANAGLESDELEAGIRRQSDTQFSVSRSLVDQVLENQGQLMRTARVIPHEENGRVVGVKLYGIRRSSLLGRLGVQNGDMLRTINGYSLTSPDSALEAYTRLRSADHLTLSVVRRGQAMTLDYSIE